jgi:hypothetical protein
MKKFFLIVTLLTFALSSNAQWFDFSNNYDRYGVGFHLGMAGLNSEYHDLGTGVSINVMGFYLDFLQGGPAHKHDIHVTNTLYNDSVAFHINAGYQIPVLKWLRIMPMVGYCQTNAGLTDATTVNVDVNENTTSIFHDYDVTSGTRKHHFNFGAGLFIKPIRWIEIYAIGSRYAIYGGISINLDSFIGIE